MATTTKVSEGVQNRLSEAVLKQRIVPSMVLAPSAHNTQPWLFAVRTGTIDILIDWERHLHVSDPSHRQLYLGLGCAIANAKVAGKYWGYNVEVNYFPLGEEKHKPVARLHFEPVTVDEVSDDRTNELFTAIADRRTDRSMYDGQALTVEEHTDLQPVLDASVKLVEDRSHILEIAKVSEKANYDALERTDFKHELSQWVRHNWTKSGDGMPGYAMGMPALLSLVSPLLIRLAPIHKQEGPKTRQQLESASAVAVILSQGDSHTEFMQAGEKMQMMWLQTTVAGLALMPIAAAIEASPETRQQIQKTISTDLLPQAILRLGHAKKAHLKATPRRSLTDCLQ